MEEGRKPFACTINGCEMTFTNEDHLNWHHKKHDMVLNLGLAQKNAEVSDQTPTPTRFIRNCEEVGLFQDLQNVNPFDETFKKAVESVKAGTLHIPEPASNDDTLHTPHIFPPVDNTTKRLEPRNDNQSNQSNDFCFTKVTPLTACDDSDADDDLMIVIDDSDREKESPNSKKEVNLKDKLKETIKNKEKSVIVPVPLEKLTKSPQKRPLESRDSDKKQKQVANGEKEKLREMNRAAQERCRKRQKLEKIKMEEEIRKLTEENAKLAAENRIYKQKIYALKELLIKHKKTGENCIEKIEEILVSNRTLPIKPLTVKHRPIKTKPVNKAAKLALPPPLVPLIKNPGENKPVLIQVMGSVSQLAVSVLPNQS